MLSVNLDMVELVEKPMPRGSIRVHFPLHAAVGTASTAVVLFELDPGGELATHTDSAEELLLVLAGDGAAHVDGETARLRTGEAAVVPAMAPHGIRNVGETTLRVLGFFSSSTVVSTFEQPIGPQGERVVVAGASTPILAHLEQPALTG